MSSMAMQILLTRKMKSRMRMTISVDILHAATHMAQRLD